MIQSTSCVVLDIKFINTCKPLKYRKILFAVIIIHIIIMPLVFGTKQGPSSTGSYILIQTFGLFSHSFLIEISKNLIIVVDR